MQHLTLRINRATGLINSYDSKTSMFVPPFLPISAADSGFASLQTEAVVAMETLSDTTVSADEIQTQ